MLLLAANNELLHCCLAPGTRHQQHKLKVSYISLDIIIIINFQLRPVCGL
jgi:hypothetical protein